MSIRHILVSAAVLSLIIVGVSPLTRSAEPEPPSAQESTKSPAGEIDHPHVSKELQAELRKQCEADAKRLCRFVIPGGGRIYRCLESHNADLSEGCRKALSEVNPKP